MNTKITIVIEVETKNMQDADIVSHVLVGQGRTGLDATREVGSALVTIERKETLEIHNV